MTIVHIVHADVDPCRFSKFPGSLNQISIGINALRFQNSHVGAAAVSPCLLIAPQRRLIHSQTDVEVIKI